MIDVARAWTEAVVGAGGTVAAAQTSAVDLVARYGEPHRRYHTADHIRAVLAGAAALADELDVAPDQRTVLALAVCAHDVVYAARPADDERRSADWARAALLAAQVPPATIDRVAALILGTAGHEADPDDVVEAILSDADLAILGSDPATYAGYAAAVRQEFASVSDEGWRTGRTAVLRSLAGRPQLFVTAGGHRRWDAAARANLAREQAQLREGKTL
jgi:predicted metal-dependent HD superfamily phosphohydrolase